MDVDRATVETAQAGDVDSFNTLVRRYQVRIFNFARTLTANDSDAEDLAQEAFIRAFKGLRRFRGDSSFKNWLYQITANAARTHFGKRTRQAPVWERRIGSDDVPQDHIASTDPDVETATIRRQALDHALSTLSRDLRLPLVLHDVEGLEYQEIATVLDVPIGTIMSRIFRARRRLRPLLAGLLSHESAGPVTSAPKAIKPVLRLGKEML